jgi:hypothetical protein
MKIKTIERIINDKFQSWVKTIKDDEVKKLVLENTILTGGSICSLLLNEPVNDFDFYFKNKETTKRVAEYYVNLYKSKHTPKHKDGRLIDIDVLELNDRIKIKIKSSGATSSTENNEYQYFECVNDDTVTEEYVTDLMYAFGKTKKENVYLPIFLSCNAITLSDDVQIVIRFFGDPETIHENYDFIHCTNYWESNTKKIVSNKDALLAILGKELKYVGSLYPIATLFRMRKFIKRGWHITAGQMLKIIMQVSEMNLKDFKVLEEQLIGVDVAYFHEIIEKLKEKNPDTIDTSYLVQLIEEMF